MSKKVWLVRETKIPKDYILSWGDRPVYVALRHEWPYEDLASHVNSTLWDTVRPDLHLEPGGGPVAVTALGGVDADTLLRMSEALKRATDQRNALLAAAKTFRIELRDQYGIIGWSPILIGDLPALEAAVAACEEGP